MLSLTERSLKESAPDMAVVQKVPTVAPPEMLVSGVTMATVACGCGKSWCFGCQQDPHWPSTCRQADAYSKMVQQEGQPTIHQFFILMMHITNKYDHSKSDFA